MEANHCRNGYWCKAHDCACPCAGCLPHSDPSEHELRILRARLAAADGLLGEVLEDAGSWDDMRARIAAYLESK